MNASWKPLSRSDSSERASDARSPKRRNSVPLPTPASAAIASIDVQLTPFSANSFSAAARIRRRLRAASARSGGSDADDRELDRGELGWSRWLHHLDRTVVRFLCYSVAA